MDLHQRDLSSVFITVGTHTLASSVLASPSVFLTEDILFPRLAAAERGVLAILATKWSARVYWGRFAPSHVRCRVLWLRRMVPDFCIQWLRLRWTTRSSRFIPRVGGSILVFPPYIPENVFSSTPWIEGSILSSLCVCFEEYVEEAFDVERSSCQRIIGTPQRDEVSKQVQTRLNRPSVVWATTGTTKWLDRNSRFQWALTRATNSRITGTRKRTC